MAAPVGACHVLSAGGVKAEEEDRGCGQAVNSFREWSWGVPQNGHWLRQTHWMLFLRLLLPLY